MYKVIKNKGTLVQAYRLGSNSAVIDELMASGKIVYLGGGRYEVHSQESEKAGKGGEIASDDYWIKVDSSGFPYPNSANYFLTHHRYLGGDTYEQIPEPLDAWDASCGPCPEIEYLIDAGLLRIDESSYEKRYTARLWGTEEAAAADAVIVFYSILYTDTGEVFQADFNFVAHDVFVKTYSVCQGTVL